MRIKEIKIEGLFGMFNHTIPLHPDHLTIIYGENGIGKTAIFKMLNWLSNLDPQSLHQIRKTSFSRLVLSFQEGSSLTLSKKERNTIEVSSLGLGLKNVTIDISKYEDPNKIAHVLERSTHLRRIASDKFLDPVTDRILGIEEAMVLYGDRIDTEDLFGNKKLGIPNDLKNFIKKINTYFIETQRLFFVHTERDRRHYMDNIKPILKDTATLYSEELAKAIKQKTAEYRKLSDDLKNSLSQRILTKQVKIDFRTNDLKQMAHKVEENRTKFKKVGLIEESQNETFEIPDDISELNRAIVAVNIQDVSTQLEVYNKDDFYERVRLFMEILNERRLTYKKIKISEEGFIFKNDNGETLNPKDLSSGEQHELVLLYQLLFTIPENSLILLDEPEISLHAAWQLEFIEDMQDIIKLKNFDILLATHSAAIINGNWDLTVSLKGGDDE